MTFLRRGYSELTPQFKRPTSENTTAFQYETNRPIPEWVWPMIELGELFMLDALADKLGDVAAKVVLDKLYKIDEPTPELIAEAKEPAAALLKAVVETLDLNKKVAAFKAAGGK